MRRYACIASIAIFCLLMGALPGCSSTPAPSIFKLDLTNSSPFEGWGTSLAWWAEVIGRPGWSSSSKNNIENALFTLGDASHPGLGLNIVRYNFGANAVSYPQNNNTDAACPVGQQSFRLGGSIGSFEPTNGTWNWNNDSDQINILSDAQKRIAPGEAIYEGFANSAPAWMLISKCTKGAGVLGLPNTAQNNLNNQADPVAGGSYEQDYATYLATIVKYFHDDLHITFRTIEPFNEPDSPWWTPKNEQEGMHVDVSQQQRVIEYLYNALQQDGASNYTAISAPDDNSIDEAVSDYHAYNPSIQSDLSQLNTHSYHGSQPDAFSQIGQQSGKRLWMSEYTTDGSNALGDSTCAKGKGSVTGMAGALTLSCRIQLDLNQMHPQAWVYWQAVEASGGSYGLIQTPFSSTVSGNESFTLTKQFYAMWQFSHFIRPGYHLLRSNDPSLVAAYDSSSGTLVLVVTNADQNSPKSTVYDLSRFGCASNTATPYVTTASQNGEKQASIPLVGKRLTSNTPPDSITTYTISGVSVASCGSSTGTNWPMFGFDPQHTRGNPSERLLTSSNVSHLVLYWTSSVCCLQNSPAVANGIVYAGSPDGKLYAFNAKTGIPVWTAPTGADLESSPAVANGIVYAGSDDHNFYAFDARTGKTLWVVTTGNWVESPPVIANGVVYVGSDDDALYALDAQTGAIRWKTFTNSHITDSPAVSNGLVYAGSFDHNLYAMNASTGNIQWVASTGDAIASSPTVVNGVVYVGSRDGSLHAFDAKTGTVVWTDAIGASSVESSPAVANGIVYVGSNDGNEGGKLYALDAKTGATLWMQVVGSVINSSPTVANGVIYVGSDDKKLYAFDARTGGILWNYTTEGYIDYSSPAVVNGVVYIAAGYYGKLYAFHLPSGTV